MDNLFKAQVRFNGGNPNLFKVRVDVTLKDLKDQLNEINQGLNPGNTRRVEDLQYARPDYLQSEKLMLKNDDYVRNMFSRYYKEHMFPRIEMETTLMRSSEDILNSLILPYNYV
ncbi:40S ribosomal S10-like protein, putative [Medicago truncatula]|uniref:40S ribosomal S10-like protein, putative n=1 Tax=Medicago truncatula TaxID=3880 RepID=G7I992_MEDTR|nr:40S ribosomal S10-like protein, putative [Medicago truncatula]